MAGPGAQNIERRECRVLLTLPPFPQTAARLGLLLQDAQVLVREDLDDLQVPLLACQALAHNTEQRATLEAMTRDLAHLRETAQQSLEAMIQRWQKETHWTVWHTEVASLTREALSGAEEIGTPG